MNTFTATIITNPTTKTLPSGLSIDTVIAVITAFGETRTIEAIVRYNDDKSVYCYDIGREFVARVGQGFKAYPTRATLWPRPDGSVTLDLRDFVLRRSVVANAWADRASEATTRVGWSS